MKRLLLIVFAISALLTGGLYLHHHIATSLAHGGCVDIPAAPDYLSSGSATDAIAALNNAHSLEHLPPLSLPANFYRLDPAQQQLILVNIERTDRHLHPLTLDANLSQMALGYSKQLRDLHFFSHTSPISGSFGDRINGNPAIVSHYSIAAENIAANPVAGVGPIYEYMYDDSVEDCGHRHNILNPALTTVGINWVSGGLYGSISAQEFIASASWSPYVGTLPMTTPPIVSIRVNPTMSSTGSTLLRFQIRIANTASAGIERIAWFLDNITGTPMQVGSAWTLDSSKLARGKHTIIVYVVDGEENYGVGKEVVVV